MSLVLFTASVLALAIGAGAYTAPRNFDYAQKQQWKDQGSLECNPELAPKQSPIDFGIYEKTVSDTPFDFTVVFPPGKRPWKMQKDQRTDTPELKVFLEVPDLPKIRIISPKFKYPMKAFQVHFHMRSEHTDSSGIGAPEAEGHMVFTPDTPFPEDDRAAPFAVMGRWFKTDDNAPENELLKLIEEMLTRSDIEKDEEELETEHNHNVEVNLDEYDMTKCPAANTLEYDGSLTTPPCWNIVKWHFCTEVIGVPKKQMDVLEKYLKQTEAASFRETVVRTDSFTLMNRPLRPAPLGCNSLTTYRVDAGMTVTTEEVPAILGDYTCTGWFLLDNPDATTTLCSLSGSALQVKIQIHERRLVITQTNTITRSVNTLALTTIGHISVVFSKGVLTAFWNNAVEIKFTAVPPAIVKNLQGKQRYQLFTSTGASPACSGGAPDATCTATSGFVGLVADFAFFKRALSREELRSWAVDGRLDNVGSSLPVVKLGTSCFAPGTTGTFVSGALTPQLSTLAAVNTELASLRFTSNTCGCPVMACHRVEKCQGCVYEPVTGLPCGAGMCDASGVCRAVCPSDACVGVVAADPTGCRVPLCLVGSVSRLCALRDVYDGQSCKIDGMPGKCQSGKCEPHKCGAACDAGNTCTRDICLFNGQVTSCAADTNFIRSAENSVCGNGNVCFGGKCIDSATLKSLTNSIVVQGKKAQMWGVPDQVNVFNGIDKNIVYVTKTTTSVKLVVVGLRAPFTEVTVKGPISSTTIVNPTTINVVIDSTFVNDQENLLVGTFKRSGQAFTAGASIQRVSPPTLAATAQVTFMRGDGVTLSQLVTVRPVLDKIRVMTPVCISSAGQTAWTFTFSSTSLAQPVVLIQFPSESSFEIAAPFGSNVEVDATLTAKCVDVVGQEVDGGCKTPEFCKASFKLSATPANPDPTGSPLTTDAILQGNVAVPVAALVSATRSIRDYVPSAKVLWLRRLATALTGTKCTRSQLDDVLHNAAGMASSLDINEILFKNNKDSVVDALFGLLFTKCQGGSTTEATSARTMTQAQGLVEASATLLGTDQTTAAESSYYRKVECLEVCFVNEPAPQGQTDMCGLGSYQVVDRDRMPTQMYMAVVAKLSGACVVNDQRFYQVMWYDKVAQSFVDVTKQGRKLGTQQLSPFATFLVSVPQGSVCVDVNNVETPPVNGQCSIVPTINNDGITYKTAVRTMATPPTTAGGASTSTPPTPTPASQPEAPRVGEGSGTAVGLGVGLGVGIPVVLLAIGAVYYFFFRSEAADKGNYSGPADSYYNARAPQYPAQQYYKGGSHTTTPIGNFYYP